MLTFKKFFLIILTSSHGKWTLSAMDKPKINITINEYALDTVIFTSIIVSLNIAFGVMNNLCKLGLKVIHKLNIEVIKGILTIDFKIFLNVFSLYLGFFSTIWFWDYSLSFNKGAFILFSNSSSSSGSIKA